MIATKVPTRAVSQVRAVARSRRALRALPAYLPAVIIAIGGWSHRWNNEDAFINFRVVDNVFAGNGPVFNAGERIEVGTSPLWIAVLSAGRALLGWLLPIEWIAVVLCLAAAVAAFALAGRSALLAAATADRDGTQPPDTPTGPADPDRTVVPLGLLAVASVAVVWDFATSGLEMSLVWLWIAACWYVLVRAARGDQPAGRRRAAGVAVIGLGPLVRPDLGVMMVCFLAAWFVLVRPRRIAADLGALLALPVAYQIFRMGYYASLVPSTALAKDASGVHVGQGWRYLADFVGTYTLWVPLAVVGATIVGRLRADRDPRRATATTAMVAAAILHGGYIVVVGGDYMHGRLLLPAFFAVALPAYVVLHDRALLGLAACALTGAWALVAIGWFRPAEPTAGIPEIADWRQMQGAKVVPDDVELQPTGILASDIYDDGVRGYIGALEPAGPGRHPDDLVVVLGSIGIPAYQLGIDVWVVDMGGLAEPLAARTDIVPGRPAGHRKNVDAAWYEARFGVVDDADTRDAARALGCEPVEGLLDAVTDDLTPGRFLSNVWHSVGHTRLRIPPDPSDAVAELCSP